MALFKKRTTKTHLGVDTTRPGPDRCRWWVLYYWLDGYHAGTIAIILRKTHCPEDVANGWMMGKGVFVGTAVFEAARKTDRMAAEHRTDRYRFRLYFFFFFCYCPRLFRYVQYEYLRYRK